MQSFQRALFFRYYKNDIPLNHRGLHSFPKVEQNYLDPEKCDKLQIPTMIQKVNRPLKMESNLEIKYFYFNVLGNNHLKTTFFNYYYIIIYYYWKITDLQIFFAPNETIYKQK